MKKLLFVLALVMGLTTLSACGSSSEEPVKKAPLAGTYKTSGGGPNFNVVIKDGVISIDLVMDEETSGLYWKGTAPDMSDGTFESTADVDALNASLVGSQSTTKEFWSDGSKISFEFQAMGVKKKIEARR